jgi:hypothetical protein
VLSTAKSLTPYKFHSDKNHAAVSIAQHDLAVFVAMARMWTVNIISFDRMKMPCGHSCPTDIIIAMWIESLLNQPSYRQWMGNLKMRRQHWVISGKNT